LDFKISSLAGIVRNKEVLAAPLHPVYLRGVRNMSGVFENAVASSSTAKSLGTEPKQPPFARQRSRGQLARRNSITRGVQDGKEHRKSGKKKANIRFDQRQLNSRNNSQDERPWLGGLYFTDLIFIAFTYTINLLRTCGIAELADIAFKGFIYSCELAILRETNDCMLIESFCSLYCSDPTSL
jgi:hypothetical protein